MVSTTLYGMVNLDITPVKPFCMATPNVSLTCMKTAVLGAAPAALKSSSWLAKASPRIIGAVAKLRNTNL